MTSLALVWITALTLVTLALGWMSTLIGLRLLNDRAQARRARDRALVIQGLSDVLRQTDGGPARLAPYVGRARLMAEALLDFLGLIRGADRERVLSLLRDLGLVEVLIGRVRRGSRAGRLASLEALAAFPGPQTAQTLRQAVRDPAPEIRMAAVRALADSGSPPSIGRLLDYGVAGDLEPSRLYAELLRRIASSDPAAAAAALHRTDLPGAQRALLLDALGLSGDYGVLPDLVAAATDAEAEVRVAAIRALGRLQHPGGETAIARGLADREWIVRSAAAEAAGTSGFSRLCDGLELLLGDPEWWVRFRAGEALVRLGDEGRRRLHAAARGTHPQARHAAEQALAEHEVARHA